MNAGWNSRLPQPERPLGFLHSGSEQQPAVPNIRAERRQVRYGKRMNAGFRFARVLVGTAVLAMLTTAASAAPLPRLKVSDNHRFLVTEDGAPFFWLGDTAWELFHRLDREEAERYLANRAARRFTVVQAVVLAELDGIELVATRSLDGVELRLERGERLALRRRV